MNPITVIRDRISKLGLDGVLLNTSEITRSFNLKYLSGFSGSDAAILITRTELKLFTDGRYKLQCKEECPDFQVHVTRDKIKSISNLLRKKNTKRLGLEGNRISFDLVSALKRSSKEIEFVSFDKRNLECLRIKKDKTEIEKIASAAKIASSSCNDLLEMGLSGKTEIEIAGRLEFLFKKKGASGESFQTIVASGIRSALPHGMPTEKIVQSGELLIVDFGCVFSDYCSDETVTLVVGNPSPQHKKIHQVVYEAHCRAIDCLEAGVSCVYVDAIARKTISDAGYGKYFLHSLGHGVGLEVHEAPYLSPRRKTILEEGMVFTIEPGIYIEGFGGVRLESLVHLTASGPEILSKAPKSLISIN
jgi:Xaa-Pro aminopeptidase